MQERWWYRHSKKYQPSELTPPELISLSCAILFFSAFFLAMYFELKAKHTIYQLVCKFFYMNHEWCVIRNMGPGANGLSEKIGALFVL